MNHATRFAAALVAALGLSLVVTPAHARPASPDVHVTGVARVCGNDVTVHHFRLENFGDQRRVLRGRVARDNGFTATFSRPLRAGVRAGEQVRLSPGQRAVVTLRSQGRVIMRTTLVGDCPTKGDVI